MLGSSSVHGLAAEERPAQLDGRTVTRFPTPPFHQPLPPTMDSPPRKRRRTNTATPTMDSPPRKRRRTTKTAKPRRSQWLAQIERVFSTSNLRCVSDVILEFALGMKLLDICKVETLTDEHDCRKHVCLAFSKTCFLTAARHLAEAARRPGLLHGPPREKAGEGLPACAEPEEGVSGAFED